MSLNGNDVPMSSSKKKQPLIEVGSYPARVVQIIDLGMQPQSFEGQEKAPSREVLMGYELVDEFVKDDEGNDQTDKPRWLSERFPLKNLKIDKARSTLRYRAIDPDNKCKGDFSKLASLPCLLSVVQEKKKDKEFNKISGVSSVRAKDADRIPPLVNEPIVFLLDDPDIEVFNNFPDWIKETIVSNLEFKGSKLQSLLSGGTPADEPAPEKEDDWRD